MWTSPWSKVLIVRIFAMQLVFTHIQWMATQNCTHRARDSRSAPLQVHAQPTNRTHSPLAGDLVLGWLFHQLMTRFMIYWVLVTFQCLNPKGHFTVSSSPLEIQCLTPPRAVPISNSNTIWLEKYLMPSTKFYMYHTIITSLLLSHIHHSCTRGPCVSCGAAAP